MLSNLVQYTILQTILIFWYQIHASKKFMHQINLDQKYLCKWLKANKISLNASKTKVLITIKIDGKKIEPSSHVEYLEFLSTPSSIGIFTSISTKLSHAVGMLTKSRHYKRESTFHGLSWNFFIRSSIWFSNLGTK